MKARVNAIIPRPSQLGGFEFRVELDIGEESTKAFIVGDAKRIFDFAEFQAIVADRTGHLLADAEEEWATVVARTFCAPESPADLLGEES